MKLSVVIPALNEAESLPETIRSICSTLEKESIIYEILVVNDHSSDNTPSVLENLGKQFSALRTVDNTGAPGFGNAVAFGLENFSGDCVAIMMADLSDDPSDLVKYYRKMAGGKYDCVFGSRFIKGGNVTGYPFHKLLLNRIANTIVRIAYGIRYNDLTNAFKLYSREAIEGTKPFLSPHYNLTLELPLKAIVRGFSFTVIPNSWTNRKHGISKFRIREMGSRYFFIFLYCLIEKYFSRGDYRKDKAKQ